MQVRLPEVQRQVPLQKTARFLRIVPRITKPHLSLRFDWRGRLDRRAHIPGRPMAGGQGPILRRQELPIRLRCNGGETRASPRLCQNRARSFRFGLGMTAVFLRDRRRFGANHNQPREEQRMFEHAYNHLIGCAFATESPPLHGRLSKNNSEKQLCLPSRKNGAEKRKTKTTLTPFCETGNWATGSKTHGRRYLTAGSARLRSCEEGLGFRMGHGSRRSAAWSWIDDGISNRATVITR